ncbi:MAG: hypothetical protein ACXWU8_05305 [Rhodoplanes sp.]
MFKDTAAKDTAAKVMGFGQALTELTVRDEVVKASAAPIFVAAPSRRCEWRAIDVVLTNLNARRGRCGAIVIVKNIDNTRTQNGFFAWKIRSNFGRV